MDLKILDTYYSKSLGKFGFLIRESRDMRFSKVSNVPVCRPLRWHSSNIGDVTTVTVLQECELGYTMYCTLYVLFLSNIFSLFFYA